MDKPFLSSAIKNLADRQPCEAEQCLPSAPNTTTLKKGFALWTTCSLFENCPQACHLTAVFL